VEKLDKVLLLLLVKLENLANKKVQRAANEDKNRLVECAQNKAD